MPVSIVVGGQFGSEGKGKVSLEIARRSKGNVTVVRVGGPNSGHIGYDRFGKKFALRQMPAGSIDRNVDVVFPAGSYIDMDVLFAEIEELSYPIERIKISNYARIITSEHKEWERDGNLISAIGSTGSGVGAAVMAAVAREAQNFQLHSPDARHYAQLQRFLCDSSEVLRKRLTQGQRVIVEGTQGFGLSLLEGGYWPKATSRSTTASAALSEAGLSPIDVDDVTMVLRTFPIRVAGDSGPLPRETTWSKIAENLGSSDDFREYTTVTKKVRRVGHFDADVVRRAIAVNHPSRLVMNHLDYIAKPDELVLKSSPLHTFIFGVEAQISQKLNWLGFDGRGVIDVESLRA